MFLLQNNPNPWNVTSDQKLYIICLCYGKTILSTNSIKFHITLSSYEPKYFQYYRILPWAMNPFFPSIKPHRKKRFPMLLSNAAYFYWLLNNFFLKHNNPYKITPPSDFLCCHKSISDKNQKLSSIKSDELNLFQ